MAFRINIEGKAEVQTQKERLEDHQILYVVPCFINLLDGKKTRKNSSTGHGSPPKARFSSVVIAAPEARTVPPKPWGVESKVCSPNRNAEHLSRSIEQAPRHYMILYRDLNVKVGLYHH